MGILTPEYIKEQAHKPCFWSEEYGFDVVAFTLAMEQNYSNRVGSKINELKRSQKQLEAENAQIREELNRYKVNYALEQTEVSSLREQLAAAQKDAERYRWLRNNEYADVRIIYIGKRTGAALDMEIDAAIAKEKSE